MRTTAGASYAVFSRISEESKDESQANLFLWMGSGMVPGLVYVSPLLLAFIPGQMDSLAMSWMTGRPVFSWVPLISKAVLCAAFVAVGIRRFNRQGF